MGVRGFGGYNFHRKLTECNRLSPVVPFGALGVENGNPRRRPSELFPEIRVEVRSEIEKV